MHVAVSGVLAESPHLLDDTGHVGDGFGVGHRMDGGETAESGGERPGLDRLGILAPGLAQVRVQVDETREGDESSRVDDLGTDRLGIDEHAVLDVEILRRQAHRPRALDDPARQR